MTATVFVPRPLPGRVAGAVHARLARVHVARPLSSTDPRETIRRVRAALADLPLELDVYRGGLDLRGVEVDHVWLGVRPRQAQADAAVLDAACVLDAAFPLFDEGFVATLRRFVAGDASSDDLTEAAQRAGVDDRVVGLFPDPMSYRGQRLWTQRRQPAPARRHATGRQ